MAWSTSHLCSYCKVPERFPLDPYTLAERPGWRAQPHARKVDETRMRMTEEERVERAAQLARTMGLLVHASSCINPACPSSNCQKVKALFQHAVTCTRKVTGGCQLCRRMWMLLQMHAKQCQAAECPVPRCRELREMRRRQIARQEDQRRVAYKGMLRAQQQAARGLPAPGQLGQGYA